MKAIKSVFNFYILCVQPLLGLFLVGYSIWSFSGEGICTADKVIACNIWNQHFAFSLALLFCLYGILHGRQNALKKKTLN